MADIGTKSRPGLIGTVLELISSPDKLLEWRFFRFAVVGGSGVVVNMLMLWLGVTYFFAAWGESTLGVAGAFAIGVSIITNFLLNDVWTWGDRDKHGLSHFMQRMGKYVFVASIAGVVQWVVLIALSKQLGIAYLLANLVAIAAGIVINYVANNAWTFKNKEA